MSASELELVCTTLHYSMIICHLLAVKTLYTALVNGVVRSYYRKHQSNKQPVNMNTTNSRNLMWNSSQTLSQLLYHQHLQRNKWEILNWYYYNNTSVFWQCWSCDSGRSRICQSGEGVDYGEHPERETGVWRNRSVGALSEIQAWLGSGGKAPWSWKLFVHFYTKVAKS